MERTFAIIKPDATTAGQSGQIIAIIEKNDFKIVGMKKIHMTKSVAQQFYREHRERPFFNDLTAFMSSNPCIVMVLEKENGIKGWRNLMGATNPDEAADGTLRKLFGRSLDNNAVHGSDAPESAKIEVAFFFSGLELV